MTCSGSGDTGRDEGILYAAGRRVNQRGMKRRHAAVYGAWNVLWIDDNIGQHDCIPFTSDKEPMPNLIQLIYASSAREQMSSDELTALLATAREKNARLGLTGLLLYRGGNFLQVLEGESESVMELYNSIQVDPRHHHVMTIALHPITKRDFPNWKMGFVNLDKSNPDDLPGYSNYLQDPFDPLTFGKKPSLALTFIRVFKENMR
jgi:hypothetical protein